MEDYIDLIIPAIGLLLYWLSTSNKKSKKRKKSQGPIEAQRPPEREIPSKKRESTFEASEDIDVEVERNPEPTLFDFEEEDDDGYLEEDYEEPKREEPVTFESLLERFTNPQKYEQRQQERNDPNKITERAKRNLGSYLPDENFGKPVSKELLNSIKVKESKRQKKTKPFNIKKYTSSPDNLRDAFIMKEIFDRKQGGRFRR